MQFVPGVAHGAARRSSLPVLSLAALCAVLIATLLVAAPSALAKSAAPGGVSARSGLEAEIPESTEVTETGETGETEYETTTSKAALIGGRAIAPLDAPAAVRRAIAAANHIRTTPYIWGGGHASFISRGYDCSGAVSFALHGAKLLTTPETSGSLETFGEAGPGKWITIYANSAHAYMVIAGLRFDTAGDESGTGPRWHLSTAAAASGRFVVRHPVGY